MAGHPEFDFLRFYNSGVHLSKQIPAGKQASIDFTDVLSYEIADQPGWQFFHYMNIKFYFMEIKLRFANIKLCFPCSPDH